MVLGLEAATCVCALTMHNNSDHRPPPPIFLLVLQRRHPATKLKLATPGSVGSAEGTEMRQEARPVSLAAACCAGVDSCRGTEGDSSNHNADGFAVLILLVAAHLLDYIFYRSLLAKHNQLGV